MSSVTFRAIVAPASIALLAGLLIAPMPAAADEPDGDLVQMQEFPTAEFTAQAAEMPADLVEALRRDVDQSPEEYLAQADAAVVAVEVVDSLEEAGVGVLGSRLDGTELIVNVETETDAAVVESTGATAELGEPAPLWSPEGLTFELATDVYDGQGWTWSNDYNTGFHLCSVGFTGYLASTGAPQYATAGHCVEGMSTQARTINTSSPNNYTSHGQYIGSKIAGSDFFGSGRDVARIAANVSGIVQKPSMIRWGGGNAAPFANAPLPLDGAVQPVVGASLCKSGTRTGFTCGPIVDVDYNANIAGTAVNSVVAQLCTLPGDSGGTGVLGKKAVGITSFTTANGPLNEGKNYCADTVAVYAGFFQMISPTSAASVKTAYGTTWEMMAAPAAPTITSITPAGGNNTAINGTVPGAGVDYSVDIYVDGSSSVFTTANVNASTGAWSANVSSLSQGVHTFNAVARYATRSTSTPTSGFIRRGITIDRIESSNRYTLAVEISKKAYPTGNAPVVYVTAGSGYADALSAGPAAALQGGVMLLTQSTSLPSEVSTEITRLSPDKIVVVGGTLSVSAGVYSQLAAIQPNIERIGGSNRFEASRNIVADAFVGENPSIAYIATGLNYPDALGASAAGGAFGYPVILVNGGNGTIDAATMTLLDDLNVTQVKVAGGSASVSDGIFNAIKSVYPSTIRISGANRYAASAAIALDAFGSSSPDWAYIATGANFPDALAGGPLAAQSGSPLFVVRQDCVPTETMNAFRSLTVNKVTLLGGTASLTSSVQSLVNCP